jgi:hypothetical protein
MTHFFCSAAKFSEIFKDVQQEHRMSQDELLSLNTADKQRKIE